MLNLSIPQILFFGGGLPACLAQIWLQVRSLNLTVAIFSDSQNRECASLNTSTLINLLINLTRVEAQFSKLRVLSNSRSKAKGSQKYAASEGKRAPPSQGLVGESAGTLVCQHGGYGEMLRKSEG
jgi:hypothetical protein